MHCHSDIVFGSRYGDSLMDLERVKSEIPALGQSYIFLQACYFF
jgi:hypothetical protein